MARVQSHQAGWCVRRPGAPLPQVSQGGRVALSRLHHLPWHLGGCEKCSCAGSAAGGGDGGGGGFLFRLGWARGISSHLRGKGEEEVWIRGACDGDRKPGFTSSEWQPGGS